MTPLIMLHTSSCLIIVKAVYKQSFNIATEALKAIMSTDKFPNAHSTKYIGKTFWLMKC